MENGYFIVFLCFVDLIWFVWRGGVVCCVLVVLVEYYLVCDCFFEWWYEFECGECCVM